jgi:hypothetical protein
MRLRETTKKIIGQRPSFLPTVSRSSALWIVTLREAMRQPIAREGSNGSLHSEQSSSDIY